MTIGIDGSRAFLNKRTGIEEYSYQVIKHLRNNLEDHEVFLYLRKNQQVDFELPKNWKIKVIKMPRLWTQAGLVLEMLVHPVDTLFVPAHTAPWIHPENTVVTVHGLEYEFCPEAYSLWERLYMRWSIRMSCKWAKEIIAVSENTKWDLVQLYGVKEEKIQVVYEGYDLQMENANLKMQNDDRKGDMQEPYLLFVGRIEERKNIANVVEAFDVLKDIYKVPHKLVLAGKPGYKYEDIKLQITNSKHEKDIVELGYVSDEEKWALLENAEAFVFPTCYEGFGIPILEAQSMGCPVIAGNNSSVPEVVNFSDPTKSSGEFACKAGDVCNLCSAVLVDHRSPKAIARAMALLINDRSLRSEMVQKGLENVKRFSWEKCSQEIAEVLK